MGRELEHNPLKVLGRNLHRPSGLREEAGEIRAHDFASLGARARRRSPTPLSDFNELRDSMLAE